MLAIVLWVCFFMREDEWWIKLIWLPPFAIIGGFLLLSVGIPMVIAHNFLDKLVDNLKKKNNESSK
jgi:hypothetical protein